MFKAIIILSLFIGTNGSYLATNCHLNETQPDLVFEKCEKIRVTDLTTSCPIYDPSLCQTNPCFCDPVTLPSSVGLLLVWFHLLLQKQPIFCLITKKIFRIETLY